MPKPLVVRMPEALRAMIAKRAQQTGSTVSGVMRDTMSAAMFPSDVTGQGGTETPTDPMAEIGVTGLQQTGGFLYEEFHPALLGNKAIQIYNEMQMNSATVQAVIFCIDMLCREVEWHVDQASDAPEDMQAADLIESSMNDMSETWGEFLSNALSMLVFGWSYHEIVYKVRNGSNELEPGSSSQFADGLIGWRKLPVRAQTTRWRWVFDQDGGLDGMWQAPWAIGGWGSGATALKMPVFIPIEKALLFRPRAFKNNPEGWSLLRAAYRPYYMAKRIEEIEVIGVERDLCGLPVAKIPAEHITSEDATFTSWKQMIRNLRRNEQEGLILPSERDLNNNPLYDFALLQGSGKRQMDTGPIIERLERRIAMTMLADFLFLGQGGSSGASGNRSGGSFALAANRTSLFALAITAILDQISSVLNRHAVPRLLALNGIQVEKLPLIQHDPVEIPDIAVLSQAISQLGAAGMPLFPDVDLENLIRQRLELPLLNEDDIAARAQHDPTPGLNDQGPLSMKQPPPDPMEKPGSPAQDQKDGMKTYQSAKDTPPAPGAKEKP